MIACSIADGLSVKAPFAVMHGRQETDQSYCRGTQSTAPCRYHCISIDVRP